MDMREMQKAIYQNKVNKGFNLTNIPQEFCYIYAEVAEAFEAWGNNRPSLGEELADVAIYLLGLSEILGIDLHSEIEKKIKINAKRHYVQVDGEWKKFTDDDPEPKGQHEQ